MHQGATVVGRSAWLEGKTDHFEITLRTLSPALIFWQRKWIIALRSSKIFNLRIFILIISRLIIVTVFFVILRVLILCVSGVMSCSRPVPCKLSATCLRHSTLHEWNDVLQWDAYYATTKQNTRNHHVKTNHKTL